MSDSDKDVETQIREAGEKLLHPPSSVDDLLSLLDTLFLCLSEVEQSPRGSMRSAISPLMKALVAGKLFKHSDVDVKVAVAACFSEITRITAPEAPYGDEQMREVFKLIISSLENLVDKSSPSYSKRISILETVAKVRSCVVMLDLECDALLIEMFQIFLKAIRDHHSENVFSSMEKIMTLVLEESEDIPPEMLSPILHYVRKDDEVPQVSRRLAEQVLSNCASKLKTYLTEALKSLGASFDKYSNIVASICEGTMQQDQPVVNEKEPMEDSQGHLAKEAEVEQDKPKAAEISTPEQIDAPKDEPGKPAVSNGIVQQNDSMVDIEATKEQDDTNGKDEPQPIDNPSNANLDYTPEEKPDVEKEIEVEEKEPSPEEKPDVEKEIEVEEKEPSPEEKPAVEKEIEVEEKEPSPVQQADSPKASDVKEKTEPGVLLDNTDVLDSSPPDDSTVNAAISSEKDNKTSVQALPSKTSADETANVGSPSRTEDLLEESPPNKKKKSSTKEAKASVASATDEVSEELNTSEAKVTKKSGKKSASSIKAKPSVPPSKKGTSKTKAAKQSEKKAVESDNAQESSNPKEEKKKTGRGKAMDEVSLQAASGDGEKPAVSSGKSASKSKKEVKQPVEENPNTNSKRKRSAGQEKASDIQNFDESLVGSRVKVWWPMDRAYYKGVVNSYDSAKKKHLIFYDDGDQESLNLKKQKWYFQHEESSEEEEAADQKGNDEETSTAPQRKKAKTTGKQPKMVSSGKKGGGAGSSKSKATPASKSSKKKSQDEKTESKPMEIEEENNEKEDNSEELSEEEENPKTVGKSAGVKSGSSKSKKDVSSGKSKATPASKSGKKKSQDDKTESKPMDVEEEENKEEDNSEELSEEEENPKTVGKSAGAKSRSSKSKKEVSSGTSKASAKKKEEPSKTTTAKSKSGPAKSSSAKGKAGKGKAKPISASTPASKAKESDAESDAEETPIATETATKGKAAGAGKAVGSQTKSGKKRRR